MQLRYIPGPPATVQLGLTGRTGSRYRVEHVGLLPISSNGPGVASLTLNPGTNWLTLPAPGTNHFYRAVWYAE
jgi:hypothetical protein